MAQYEASRRTGPTGTGRRVAVQALPIGGEMSKLLLRVSGALLVALFVSACSWLPLSYTMDLKPQLGSSSSDVVRHEIGSGDAGDFGLRHPEEGDECIAFTEADIPVTVESARLHYNATVDYAGPELSGRVTAQLYLSHDIDNLWLARNKVGPQVTVNLNDADARLAGTAVLNNEQVDGINAKHLCWGLRITGDDVRALGEGTATISYEVKELKLAIRYSVI